VFVFAALCFVNGLNGAFLFDDNSAIVKNEDVQGLTPLSAVFENDYWGKSMTSKASHKTFRPITTLTYRLNVALNGGKIEPFWFHVTNVLLHGLVASSLVPMCMALVFEGDLEQSFLTGLLFAAHPVHVEAVTGIVGRAEIVSALFLVLAGLCYAQSKRQGVLSSAVWMVLSLAMCAAAMLGKEQGITAFGILAAYELFCVSTSYRREQQRQIKQPEPQVLSCNHSYTHTHAPPAPILTPPCTPHLQFLGLWSILRIIAIAAAALSLLYWRMQLMKEGGGAPKPAQTQNPGWYAPTAMSKVLTLGHYACLHFWLLLCPLHLCCDWSHDAIHLVTDLQDPRNGATALLLLLLVAAALALLLPIQKGWKCLALDEPSLVMGFALLLLPFLPSSNLFFPVGFAVAERVLYTPSIGFCILLVVAARRLLGLTSGTRLRGLIVLVACVYAARTAHRNPDWKDAGEIMVPHAIIIAITIVTITTITTITTIATIAIICSHVYSNRHDLDQSPCVVHCFRCVCVATLFASGRETLPGSVRMMMLHGSNIDKQATVHASNARTWEQRCITAHANKDMGTAEMAAKNAVSEMALATKKYSDARMTWRKVGTQ
jgi:hypothetical protein